MLDSSLIIQRDLLDSAMRKVGIRNLSELSKRAGVHRNTLNFYLSGQRSPVAVPLLRIASVLQISAVELLGSRHTESIDARAQVCKKLAPICEAYPKLACILFGSRAKGTASKFSDWDIGLSFGKSALDVDTYLLLKDQILISFDQWHFSVDVVNLDLAPLWFLTEIDYEPQLLVGNAESYGYFMGWLNAKQETLKVAEEH